MERAFGVPLEHVRVHTDAEGVELAEEHRGRRPDNRARHIAFGAAGFQPESEEGTLLLAHELAHVVQNGGGDGVAEGTVSEPSESVEHEAETAAGRVVRGEPAA